MDYQLLLIMMPMLRGLAEAVLGAGKDYKTNYFITCSTGVGGAFVVDKN